MESVPVPPSWCDYATVCVKYKCKICNFETEELPVLKRHYDQSHSESNGQPRPGSERRNSLPPVPPTQGVKLQMLPQHKVEFGVQSPASSEIYLCSECNVTFESETLCYEHMSFEHGLEEFNESITSNESQQDTKPSPPSPLPVPFTRPRRQTRPPKLLTLEEGGVVVPKKYRKDSRAQCTMCRAKFEQEEILQIHLQCHNRKLDTINVIDLSQSSAIEEQQPKKVLGYSCIFCKSTTNGTHGGASEKKMKFCKWGQCAMHLFRKHGIDCELYQCPQCPFKSYAKTTLAEHENVHGVVSNFKCKTCHKTFKQLSQLKNHEKWHREKSTKLAPPNEERWYTPKVCPICSRVLSDQKCLKRHISYVHDKLKQHVCNVCGYMSARKAELQLHMKQHNSGEKPFKCQFCEFTTIYPASVRRHKLQHTQNYTYHCQHCDYKCIQANAFKLHMKTRHPGEEGIYKCSNCPFESVNSTLYEVHVKRHSYEDSTNGSANAETGNESSSTNDTDTAANPSDNDAEDLPDLEQIRRKISIRTKSWLQDESDSQDSSVPVQDNIGGVTIPAPE